MKKFISIVFLVLLAFTSVIVVGQDKPVPMPKSPQVTAESKEHLMIFGADWCDGCVALRTKLATSPRVNVLLRSKFLDKITRVDIDKDTTLKKEFKIETIPTLVVYKIEDGKNVEIRRVVGNVSLDELVDFLNPEVRHFKIRPRLNSNKNN